MRPPAIGSPNGRPAVHPHWGPSLTALADQLARYEEIVRGGGDPFLRVPPVYSRDDVVEAMQAHGLYPAEDAITWFAWLTSRTSLPAVDIKSDPLPWAMESYLINLQVAADVAEYPADWLTSGRPLPDDALWYPGWLALGFGGLVPLTLDLRVETDTPPVLCPAWDEEQEVRCRPVADELASVVSVWCDYLDEYCEYDRENERWICPFIYGLHTLGDFVANDPPPPGWRPPVGE